ncbi:DUF1573 domain-containing protein [Pedobacter hiemivivus]|uniref:DUF1573 domain-containing protein n=1 Tax=Pedobacter hiemivivus TaxID=2530454 RepID=A0A4V2MK03_9SPHI|nr:DUF1573 domain-containing protein [Pedobacter hiemivivus]TCC96286.1 DUF1573 domain-containing protein [Pedobacter hiemivivus]
MSSLFRFCLIILFFCASCKKPDKISFVTGGFEGAFQKAKLLNKKVFVFVTDSACNRCNDFLDFLNKQKVTVDVLKRDYVCYKADLKNINDQKFIQLIKCPSYPFPYFFDSNGKLLAFGFPNSKIYDITDLSKITLDNFNFRELYNLSINQEQYKTLITMNLNAYLKYYYATDLEDIKESYEIFYQSLSIAAYPFNIYYSKLNLNMEKQRKKKLDDKIANLNITSSDQFIYQEILKNLNIKNVGRKQLEINEELAITPNFEKVKINLNSRETFTFYVKNLTSNPLAIEHIDQDCTCLSFKWNKKPIMPNKYGQIKVTYHSNELGQFEKNIFVHTTSAKSPMYTLKIKGETI